MEDRLCAREPAGRLAGDGQPEDADRCPAREPDRELQGATGGGAGAAGSRRAAATAAPDDAQFRGHGGLLAQL